MILLYKHYSEFSKDEGLKGDVLAGYQHYIVGK